MNDLQRFLQTEYRDVEYQHYQLSRERDRSGGTTWTWVGFAGFGALCLLLSNVLY